MAGGMSEKNLNDSRVEPIKQRLKDDLVNDEGDRPDPAQVDVVVETTAESLATAPVQEFTPLLIEHQARDALRRAGFSRDLSDGDGSEPAP
jgi:hypothetical protein